MMAEHVENFILELIKKTQSGGIEWKVINKLYAWKNIKKEIEKEIGLDGYFINESNSYGINKCGGHVMLLNLRYSKALVFSPALDKYVLFIKINDDFLPENISKYDHQEYKDLLLKLFETIEMKEKEKYIMPDCMYDFFEKFLEEDKNGRTIDE